MSKKIVFFDIDGTLLNEKKQLCKTTIHALNELKKRGVYVALATGRPPFMFKQLRKMLNIDTYVSYTGSYVVCENELIYENTMDINKVTELHEDAILKNIPIVLMGKSFMQVTVDNHPDVIKVMERLQFDYPTLNVVVPNEPVYQVLLFKRISKSYAKLFPQFQFIQWSKIASDVLPATSSKSVGMKQIVQKLNINIENTYAFGDGMNDLDLMSTVGTSVAMGNAVDEVKEAADFVTTRVDESGIAKGLNMLGLL